MNEIMGLVAFWRKPQAELREVFRWEGCDGILSQSTMDHTHGIMLLATVVMTHMPHVNEALVITGFLVHDHPEMDLGDTLVPDKTNEKEVQEYLTFVRHVEALAPVVQKKLIRSFLLQFCLKSDQDRAEFPKEAQEIMNELRENHMEEIHLFHALEHFDYMMQGLAEFQAGSSAILNRVIRHRVLLSDYAESIPGFNELWTPTLAAWLDEFAAESIAAE